MTGNKTGNSKPGLLLLVVPAVVIICLFSCGQVVAAGPVWDLENRNFQADLQQVRHLNGRFLAVGRHGVVLESVDGVDWQHRDVMGCTVAYDIAYSGAAYLVVGEGPTGNVWWSNDLVAWNETVTPGGGSLRGVLWDGSSFIAVGSSVEIANSPDGQGWSAEISGVSETLNVTCSPP